MKYKISTSDKRATLHSRDVAASAFALGMVENDQNFRWGVAALAQALGADNTDRIITREQVANAASALLRVAPSVAFVNGVRALAASQGTTIKITG